MAQKDPLGPGAMAIEWHTQNCIFRKDLGEMVTVGVAISGWFKRCLEGGVGSDGSAVETRRRGPHGRPLGSGVPGSALRKA